MLLHLSDVKAERNASDLRHCTGRIVLEPNERIPDCLSGTTVLGSFLSMHAVVNASSIQKGNGLFILDLENWWITMNYAGEELPTEPLRLTDGRVSGENANICLFTVE